MIRFLICCKKFFIYDFDPKIEIMHRNIKKPVFYPFQDCFVNPDEVLDFTLCHAMQTKRNIHSSSKLLLKKFRLISQVDFYRTMVYLLMDSTSLDVFNQRVKINWYVMSDL